MKYALALIVIVGLAVGTYWFVQPRPSCGAMVNGECLTHQNIGVDCTRLVYSPEVCPTLQVKPSDNQSPNYNPQQTENGAEL